jgi:hypothetical protein
MDKRIVIPFGKGKKEITESEVRNAQASNLINMSTNNEGLIDAILSYFAINCMATSGKTQLRICKRLASR